MAKSKQLPAQLERALEELLDKTREELVAIERPLNAYEPMSLI